jgi:hypothetical protein
MALAFSAFANRADAQQFTSTPVTTATVGQRYVYNVVASGQSNVQIVAPNGLPPWLTLTGTGDGTATLAGVPTLPDSVWTVLLRAEDNVCRWFIYFCPVQLFDITVTASPNQTPVIVPPGIPDQQVTVNDSLSVDVAPSFTDPDGDPLTFSAAGLPPGFSLVGSVISGVPPTSATSGSPYTVSVTANDGRSGTAADVFVLNVVPLARADIFLASMTVTPAPATRNGSVDWVVTVGNTGPSPSGSIQLLLEFAGNLFTFTTNPCTLAVEADRQRLDCTLGPIESGATQSLTLTGSAPQPGDVYVRAALASAAVVPIDPNTNNNASTLSLNVAETVVTDAAETLPVGPTTAVAAGDVNGDGFADVTAATSGEQTGLLLNIEAPSALNPALVTAGDVRRGLASVPLSFGAAAANTDVALADFDGDGNLDVVVANGPGNQSAAFRNDGNSVLTQLATLGAGARTDRAVATGDVDGDGRADVVIGASNGTWLYRNQNGGAFVETQVSGAVASLDVVLVDVVGSTLPDLILVNANGVTARHENSGGSFGAAVTIDSGPASAVASADFNRDGRADLVLARQTAPTNGVPSNGVYLNNNAGGFVAVASLGASPTTDVVTGDVDGDGSNDVVAVNATGAHQLFLGDGNGNFRLHPRVLVSRGALRGTIAPIGRLQRPDLVIGGTDAIDVFFNDGHGNLGLGDAVRPVIALVGAPEVTLEVETPYQDQGATVTDDIDANLTPAVDNPVNPK